MEGLLKSQWIIAVNFKQCLLKSLSLHTGATPQRQMLQKDLQRKTNFIHNTLHINFPFADLCGVENKGC